jgi:hypothetical protein
MESPRSRPAIGAQGLIGSFVVDTLPKQAPAMGCQESFNGFQPRSRQVPFAVIHVALF